LKIKLQKEYSGYFDFDLPKNFTVDLSKVQWSHGWPTETLFGNNFSSKTKDGLKSMQKAMLDVSVAFDKFGKALEASLVSIPTFSGTWVSEPVACPEISCTFCGGDKFCMEGSFANCLNCSAEFIKSKWRIGSEMLDSVVGKAVLAQWVVGHGPRRIIDRLIIHFTKRNLWTYVYLLDDVGKVRVARKDPTCNVASVFGSYQVLLNTDSSCSTLDGETSGFAAWMPV
jgi:hypothetical protein